MNHHRNRYEREFLNSLDNLVLTGMKYLLNRIDMSVFSDLTDKLTEAIDKAQEHLITLNASVSGLSEKMDKILERLQQALDDDNTEAVTAAVEEMGQVNSDLQAVADGISAIAEKASPVS